MDNFREWLSDNLRYFMLGGAILLIVAVLFFGVRACIGSKKGNSGQQGTDQQSAEDNGQGNVPSSPDEDGETNDGKKEDTNPMEKNQADISALVKSYYKALGEKDIATLRTFVNDLTPSDEAKITNARDYIEGYEVGDVYSKKGLTEDSYVVYVVFDYICKGVDTPAPALSQFYMVKDSSGNLKVEGNAEQDPEISAYTEELQKEPDVAQLLADVQAQYDKAQEEDPALAAFLEGLGKEAEPVLDTADTGTLLTVKEECNVRDSASQDGNVMDILSIGTQVEKVGQEGEWIQVKYDGGTGYIHSSLLE